MAVARLKPGLETQREANLERNGTMVHKLNDKDEKFVESIKQRQKEIDWEFIAKTVVASMANLPIPDQIERVVDVLNMLSDLVMDASKAATTYIVNNATLEIDRGIDQIKGLLITSSMFDNMAKLIEQAAIPDTDVPNGLFDISNEEQFNATIETLRREMIYKRNELELRRKRRQK